MIDTHTNMLYHMAQYLHTIHVHYTVAIIYYGRLPDEATAVQD